MLSEALVPASRLTSLSNLVTVINLIFLSLQRLDLSGNKIPALTPYPQPKLNWLNLTKNRITTCESFTGNHELITLLLGQNKLVDCKGLSGMANLQELNLHGNLLTSFGDLKGLGCLKKLNVGKNQLVTLANFPALPALESFDASENKINEGASKDGRTNELTNL